MLPPGAVPVGVRRVAGRRVEGSRRGGGLGDHPVHPLAYDGTAGPVDGVDEPVRAVDRPALAHRRLEERHGVPEQPVGRRRPQGCAQVQRKPRPLEPVADRRAVGPERVRRVVGVVIQQRGPRGVEVLRDPPGVRGSEVAHDPAGDPSGLLPQRRVAEHVRGRQQCLDGVHVGVYAAVAVERRPGLVPLLDEHPVGVVPEAGEQHLEGLLEQLAAAGSIRGRDAGGRQDDERMLVGRLGGRDRTLRRDRAYQPPCIASRNLPAARPPRGRPARRSQAAPSRWPSA